MEVKKIPHTVWSFLWEYFSRQKVLFFGVLVALLLSEFFTRVSLYYAAEVVEVLSENKDRGELFEAALYLSFMATLFLLIRSIVHNMIIFAESRFMPKCVADVAKDLFSYSHCHSTAFFAQEMAGNISAKVKTIIDDIYPVYYTVLWGFIAPLIAIVITVGFIVMINLELALILFILNLLLIWVVYVLSRKMIPVSEKRANTMSEANGILVDSISNAALVKSFTNYRFEKKNYFRYMKTAARADRKETRYFAIIFIWQNILKAILQAVFYIIPVWYWYVGKISIADFVLIQSMIAVLSNTFNLLSVNFMQFFKLYGSIKDGLALLSQPNEVFDKRGAKVFSAQTVDISFQGVGYGYDKENALFNAFSLSIKAGEKVGLVGRSGSGKSTLVKILSRYYDIQDGEILLNSENIADLTQDSLRQHISLIPQDPSLFNRTIMENIRYGKNSATDEEVVEAAKKAHIHELIKTLPQGYNANVGERGTMLSGGERQRIAIARAILKNAPILILDEATSALDSASENYIQQSLSHLMQGKTVIAIAHRLSTLKEMDKIVVLDKGKIVEQGSPQELIDRKGAYWSFYQMQITSHN